MNPSTLRYRLPKKSIKSDCPACGPKHRRTLSRYVDQQTGEVLPEAYGKCDRESNCGYHLSPYHQTASGLSYADEVYERWKEDNSRAAPRQFTQQNGNSVNGSQRRFAAGLQQPQRVSSPPSASELVYAIPDEVFERSLGHYDRNQFARLLREHFGMGVADDLMHRFQVGTSARWPGACVFWYVDEKGRKRGGQIKLFDERFHTVKYVDGESRKRSKTDWVHSALLRRLKQDGKPVPDWLTQYDQHADRSPCLFGLPQLLSVSADYPVAIVEAPKTAMLCTPYFPEYVWLAVGALTYLNLNESGLQRLAPVRGRPVTLFPDLSTDGSSLARWSQVANELNQVGFQIAVSRLLEDNETDERRRNGSDLADYLLEQWKGYPPDWS